MRIQSILAEELCWLEETESVTWLCLVTRSKLEKIKTGPTNSGNGWAQTKTLERGGAM